MFERQELWHICSVDSNSSTAYANMIRIGELMITNIYKPPNIAWSILVLPTHGYISVWTRNFNSHHASSSYDNDTIANNSLNGPESRQAPTVWSQDAKNLPFCKMETRLLVQFMLCVLWPECLYWQNKLFSTIFHITNTILSSYTLFSKSS